MSSEALAEPLELAEDEQDNEPNGTSWCNPLPVIKRKRLFMSDRPVQNTHISSGVTASI